MTTQTNNATQKLQQILRQNRDGHGVGVYAICSANRYVIEAGIQQAQRDESLLLIESTSNQVNQFGGYTGQQPADFAKYVRDLAESRKFPLENVVLGGDHLGPHVWRKEPAAQAMEKACVLLRESVLAGYTKIHLDASMHCADDPENGHGPLTDEIVSARAAEMCEAAEQAHRSLSTGAAAPIYVIGTEVPIPGGELEAGKAPDATRTEDLEKTVCVTKEAFHKRGLDYAWERVIAVVVQPGVEFGDASVFPYERAKASKLSSFANAHWHGVFEAHSTDYQAPEALREMVQDHFAILKVGPWLTFAFREAVFALAAVEQEWLAGKSGVLISQIREVLEKTMLENPVYWQGYYHGNESELRLARSYSYSDRSRYYWPQPVIAAALDRLMGNLTVHPPPLSLLSQYLPRQAVLIRSGQLSAGPAVLIRNKILEVLDVYATACGMRSKANRSNQC
jgi:D-tagatose-1,6-bisphosphate aldolase subunit GatZ/KbaZ